MPKNHIGYLLLSFLVGILACQSENTSKPEVYTRPAEEKLDSLNTWFSTEDNFSDKNYLPQFYKHFNQKLEAKQFEEAATLLYYTGQVVSLNSKSDSLLIKTHKD